MVTLNLQVASSRGAPATCHCPWHPPSSPSGSPRRPGSLHACGCSSRLGGQREAIPVVPLWGSVSWRGAHDNHMLGSKVHRIGKDGCQALELQAWHFGPKSSTESFKRSVVADFHMFCPKPRIEFPLLQLSASWVGFRL